MRQEIKTKVIDGELININEEKYFEQIDASIKSLEVKKE